MSSGRRGSLGVALLALLVSVTLADAQQLITTVAGSTWVFPATPIASAKDNAPLGAVLGVTVVLANAGPFQTGDVIVSDFGNRMVFQVRGTSLTVLAGNGIAGFSGDGGAATGASLAIPFGTAVDTAGNLYIADALNHRVRKVDAITGVISTVAGNGTAGFAGDGAVGGATTTGQLNFPTGVAVNAAGDVFIADRDSHRIRKLTVSTATLTTVAGTGVAGFANGAAGQATSVAQFNTPSGVAVDTSGNVYIADTLNHRVRKLTVSTATVTTIAGNGTAAFAGDGVAGAATTTASLNQPAGVALDASSNVFIADSSNQRIRKLTVSTATITSVAGNGIYGFFGDTGSATIASLAAPAGVAVDGSGNFYIADADNARVRKVTGATIDTLAGNGKFKYVSGTTGVEPAAALSAFLNNPNSAAVDSDGNLYIADTGNHRIRKVTPAGTMTTFAGIGLFGFSGDGVNGGVGNAALNGPSAVAVNTLASPNQLYIADTGNQRVRVVDLGSNTINTLAGNGIAGYNGDAILPTVAQLNAPSGVAVERSSGDVYIADRNNHRVRRVSGSLITTVAGNGTAGFAGDGVVGGAATTGQLNSPVAVTVDTGALNLYIADRNNHRVRKVNGETITTLAGNGTAAFAGDPGDGTVGGAATSASLNFPSGVAVDGSGSVYIGDRDNFRIRKVSGGNISTVAGTGAAGFSGDGALAIAAKLAGPAGLWLDAFGNLYAADSPNDRIRKLFSGQIIAGSAQGAPGAQVNIPITLALFGGATLDSVLFGLQVVPVTGPALAAPLSFVKDAAFAAVPDPTTTPSGNDSISVSWLSQAVAPFPLGGTIKLGDVVVTIPGAALDGQTYTVKITAADGSLGGAAVPLSPGPDATLTAAIGSYLVGDSSPLLVNLNPGFDADRNDPLEFGDGVLTILDLIDTLRAVLNIPGFVPASCSARFNAIDAADGAGNAGSDGVLTNFDLLLSLRRVTGIDATRERRTATLAMLACIG